MKTKWQICIWFYEEIENYWNCDKEQRTTNYFLSRSVLFFFSFLLFFIFGFYWGYRFAACNCFIINKDYIYSQAIIQEKLFNKRETWFMNQQIKCTYLKDNRSIYNKTIDQNQNQFLLNDILIICKHQW